MSINTNFYLKCLLFAVISASVVACSPSASDSVDLSSRALDTGTPGSKATAVCNEAKTSSLGMKMKAAMNAAGTAYRLDSALLKLTTLPSSFTAGTDYFHLWRWMASTNNSTYIDPTPLTFYLYDTVSAKNVTGVKNSLKWSDVSAAAETMGVDAAAFFERVILVVDLKDVNGEFDVLKLARYATSSSTAAESLDILLPIYYANPADYAYEPNGATRASVLTNLHPFKNMTGQGWSTSQFVSAANSFCF